MVFFLGEVIGFSVIFNYDEFFFVGVFVMVVKGCDGLLIKLVLDLVEVGIIKIFKVGGILNGDKILMRREVEDFY